MIKEENGGCFFLSFLLFYVNGNLEAALFIDGFLQG